MLSIVIPALDCADSLARTLTALAGTRDARLDGVVVGGGAKDGTPGPEAAAGASVGSGGVGGTPRCSTSSAIQKLRPFPGWSWLVRTPRFSSPTSQGFEKR